MRLLYVADGRSPIALNWIAYFVESGHEVHLASTYPCTPDIPLASLAVIPLAFSELKSGEGGEERAGIGALSGRLPVGLRTRARQWLAPLTFRRAAGQLTSLIASIQPDLAHAMRIPYEGMLAALGMEDLPKPPLLISVWGNDFSLHAPSTPLLGRYTRRALKRADGLHTDCYRDQRLAKEWGFARGKPAVVLPGGGGVQPVQFYPGDLSEINRLTVINPRGLRAYVRNDTFFHAIPLVLAAKPEVRFICPAMAGEPQAERWVAELGIGKAVALLPKLFRSQMGSLFRQSALAVSITTHDGTPNTLLEALACGCFPIAGDIEPLREWIAHGKNGLLVDPGSPQALAAAILFALDHPELRAKARKINTRLIAERADYRRVMRAADDFYRQIIKFPES
jgi:glycosyltransferase involved in cell wall biosynthesis